MDRLDELRLADIERRVARITPGPLPDVSRWAVKRALGEAMQANEPGPLEVTHARHLDGRQAVPLSTVQPRLIRTSNPVGNADRNSVDLEREMVKLGENQVVYQALAQLVAHKFAQLRLSIREGDV